ncbi:hypothetical protein M427DRAFT_36358 [Gonapodya prolifera JEL478]|uniref:Calcineurin-like phosphoesterase domain-containing protein n=1 Tax=Gonapodya prolifera (strain JEL478) TaxID=1344416 RepID=A0A139A325_GONPJ|nr:hypothetical protein M427DRAFT_36358 [Gonapodya prolifera JEL478]|eukprot:KXS11028.1 hypothetical protein M427DRAFT_36358 [Gonapodya prolifera JEL478]
MATTPSWKHTLRILVAGDVHARLDGVAKLQAAVRKWNWNAPDMVLLCGDLANADHDLSQIRAVLLGNQTTPPKKSASAESAEAKRRAQDETDFNMVLDAFEETRLPVLYIPGNHDPRSAFPDLDPALLPEPSSLPPHQGFKSAQDPKAYVRSLNVGKRSPRGAIATYATPTTRSEWDGAPMWQKLKKLKQGSAGASENVHGKIVRLAPKLLLASYGGSVPQTMHDNPARKAHLGFPYDESAHSNAINSLLARTQSGAVDSDLYEKHLATRLDKKKAHVTKSWGNRSGPETNAPENEPECVILMTHCGPAGVGTTHTHLNLSDPAKLQSIETGSHSLRKILTSSSVQTPTGDAPSVIAAIHGHAHFSQGLAHLGTVPVINAGPMRDGYVAMLTLIENSAGSKTKFDAFRVPRWTLGGTQFMKLD